MHYLCPSCGGEVIVRGTMDFERAENMNRGDCMDCGDSFRSAPGPKDLVPLPSSFRKVGNNWNDTTEGQNDG